MRRTKLVSNLLLFAAVALILCAALAVPASAATLTVGTGGQFKTIQQAVDAANPGDTVLVAPGTYAENVVVNKSVTVTAASVRPTVQAADSSKDVFLLTSPGVRIDGLTLAGASGASGVQIQNTSKCVVTNVVARDNARAVYLSFSTNNEVSNSSLAGNGYGVYADYSSSNTISSNVATSEKGAGNALGDGVYFYYSDSNTVTQNNLSANHVFGISLFHSSGNDLSNNTMSANEEHGVRLGEASNNNTLTFNTISGNSQLGILILSATSNKIYLNDFISQPDAVRDASAAILNSPETMVYTYGGVERTGYMSNYYSDYKGNDSNGTGIGSTPSAYGDKYPLIQPIASYGTIIPASAVTATPSPSLSIGQNQSTTATSNQSSNGTGLPGFETPYAVAGLLIAALVILLKHRRQH